MILARYGSVKAGIEDLLGAAHSMKRNLQCRIKTPVLKDGTDLWATWLDSKTVQLYGGINEDNRHRFKIDHSFDLGLIVGGTVSSDGAVHFEDKEVYTRSQGTEFIIISKSDVKGAEQDYAIRQDKYAKIREELNMDTFGVKELMRAGAFKINTPLTKKEVPAHDGWLELAVGKNNAKKKDYLAAKQLIIEYVKHANERGCFKGGTGMNFYVDNDVTDYKARLWCVGSSGGRSCAYDRSLLGSNGRFLRVSKKAAEGGALQKPRVDEAYDLVKRSIPQLTFGRITSLYRKLGNYIIQKAGKQ